MAVSCHGQCLQRLLPATEADDRLSRNQTDASPDPECMLRIRQTQNLMRQALGILTRREREAVVLRHIEGFSAAETAAILNLEAATVRSRTHSARTKLANHLRDRYPTRMPISGVHGGWPSHGFRNPGMDRQRFTPGSPPIPPVPGVIRWAGECLRPELARRWETQQYFPGGLFLRADQPEFDPCNTAMSETSWRSGRPAADTCGRESRESSSRVRFQRK